MIQHASDCGLHNAPAAAPTRCTCGKSFPFKLWGYSIANDTFGYTEHSRESLVGQIGAAALRRCAASGYRNPAVGGPHLRAGVLIRRATLDAFEPVELAEIAADWSQTWERDEQTCKRHGISDVVCELDGSPLRPEMRAHLAAPPTEEEVKHCLSYWFDWWLRA